MDLLKQFVQILIGILSKNQKPLSQVINMPARPAAPVIDWSNPKCPVTEHFTVADACMLHSWNRLANEADGFDNAAKEKIIAVCKKMEEIRAFLGCPITVHCMFRSQKYNQEIVKAIPNDVHAQSLACDFDCNGHLTIAEVHSKLESVLEKMGIRMERDTDTWVHVDLHPVINARYFKA